MASTCYDIVFTYMGVRLTNYMAFLDLQNVTITLRILHRPDPSKLPNIYLNIGLDYAERVLPSITNEVLKAVVVRFIECYCVILCTY